MFKTPFLTGFPTHLFDSAKKKTQEIVYEKRRSLIEGTLDYQQQFIEEIPPELLERYSQTERKRHYPDSLTFWAFFISVAKVACFCASTLAYIMSLLLFLKSIARIILLEKFTNLSNIYLGSM